MLQGKLKGFGNAVFFLTRIEVVVIVGILVVRISITVLTGITVVVIPHNIRTNTSTLHPKP